MVDEKDCLRAFDSSTDALSKSTEFVGEGVRPAVFMFSGWMRWRYSIDLPSSGSMIALAQWMIGSGIVAGRSMGPN